MNYYANKKSHKTNTVRFYIVLAYNSKQYQGKQEQGNLLVE